MDEKVARTEKMPYHWCSNCSSLVLLYEEKGEKCPVCGYEEIEEIKVLDKTQFHDYLMLAYERLRENYEMNNRHVEAGDFYIGEMEARREWLKYRKKESLENSAEDGFHRVIMFLYKYTSLYGESLSAPLVWIFSFVLIFAFIFIHFCYIGFWNSLYYSLLSMYQLPPKELPYEYTSIERLIGLLFNALFIMALNRKFRRKGKAS